MAEVHNKKIKNIYTYMVYVSIIKKIYKKYKMKEM